jgi:hypothetical protein
MRIEQLARQLPVHLAAGTSRRGRIVLRLWGLVAAGSIAEAPMLRRRVLRVQRVYGLSSEYLHSRCAGLVPPPTELQSWQEDVAELESAVRLLIDAQN